MQFLNPWILLQIHSQKRRTGVIAPKRFVQRLKKDNELFRSYMHQVRETLSLSIPLGNMKGWETLLLVRLPKNVLKRRAGRFSRSEQGHKMSLITDAGG